MTTAVHWLAYAAVSSFVLFAATSLAVLVCNQPVKRLRLIQWALLGCLLAPCLNQWSGMPQWHLGLVASSAAASGMADSDPGSLVDSHILAKSSDPEATIAGAEMPEVEPTVGTFSADPSLAAILATAESSAELTPTGPEGSPIIGPAMIVLVVYAGIMCGLFLRWLIGLRRLIRLKRSSRPAGPDVADELRRIAGGDPRADRVLVRTSDRLDMPLTFGLLRPVILIPDDVCGSAQRDRMRYYLAHEWAHVKARDILPWYLATLTQFLYFYQPLFWWLRRQMRLCQDHLADAFAAGQTAAPEDYAEFLVELTQKRLHRSCPAALGFADGKSNLFRRVIMLLEKKPPESRCRRTWNVVAGLTALAVVAGLASVRLDADDTPETAREQAVTQRGQEQPEQEAVEEGASITYSGVVIDRITKQPLPGTTVLIERTLSRPPAGMEDFKKTTEVQTDENGKYSFTLSPEEVAQNSLFIVVDAYHPDYVAKGRSGYAHSMIQKNLKLGEPPFYAKIRLWPGLPVTGRVVSANGQPVEGVEVLTYSRHQQAERFDFGGFYTTETDEDGRFRFVAATPGEGVYWITPPGYAPQAHIIPEDRGDVGDVVVRHGVKLAGTVLSARGEPVPGVRVEARRSGDGEDVDRFLGQHAIGNQIGRQSTTDANGKFQLDELPAGSYGLNVESVKTGWLHVPLQDVFVRQAVTITEGDEPGPLEIRAVPHVEIHVRFVNSDGQPTAGHRFHVFGRLDGRSYFSQSTRPDGTTGLGILRVPHGMTETQVGLMTNEHSVLRWRREPGAPLQSSRRIDLGTVEDDVYGLEVVRYVAPILLVKAVDEDGEQLRDFKPKAVYPDGESPEDPNAQFINGVEGDVHFEQQPDGRWRSSQLLPDQNVTVIAEMDDRTTEAQVLSLEEGAMQEVVFVMK